MPLAQGLQQVPNDPQIQAQDSAGGEALRSQLRRGHPSSRRSQPPDLRGSS